MSFPVRTQKEPEHCVSLADVRAEIDRIDEAIVRALGTRFQYVLRAADFKTDAESVRASERRQAMMRQRRAWAEESGLDADVIEKLYSDLVAYFIQEELRRVRERA
jgi:isochorismate pyruvate lyase